MNSETLAQLAAEAADDRKAVDIRLLRVEEVTTLTDWFVVCSGLSDVQVRAIARSVEDRLEEEVGRLPLRREGVTEGRWVLLDYGDLIVQVLTPQERSYYDLEAFWGHGESISFSRLTKRSGDHWVWLHRSAAADPSGRAPHPWRCDCCAMASLNRCIGSMRWFVTSGADS